MLALTLEIMEQETHCVTDRFPLDIIDLKELIGLAAPSLAEATFSEEEEYVLSDKALQKIYTRYVGDITPSDIPLSGILRKRHQLDNLTYFVHTNGELRLMRLGIKPLACFCFGTGEEDVQQQILLPFAPYVENGTFLKHEFSIKADENYPISFVTYSLRGEEWRAKAMELLKRSSHSSGWNESMERMEGSLLGYSDAQNEEYLTRIYRPRNT